jgi:hypothetical protein
MPHLVELHFADRTGNPGFRERCGLVSYPLQNSGRRDPEQLGDKSVRAFANGIQNNRKSAPSRRIRLFPPIPGNEVVTTSLTFIAPLSTHRTVLYNCGVVTMLTGAHGATPF